jgi:phosphonate utilization transcriptional regulator
MDIMEPNNAIQLLLSSSLPMFVQEEIERLIMTGELPPGTRINESELAARFGTSRGPVREACRTLEEAGLVRAEKNRGTFVREISVEEADEIYELREALEEIVGRRAALRITPELAERLNGMVDAMEAAANERRAADYAQLNLQFHELLLECAASRKLSDTYRRLVKELHLFRMRALTEGGGLDVSALEHRQIVAAIASGNADEAGAALRAHVAVSRARMLKAFGRGPAAD